MFQAEQELIPTLLGLSFLHVPQNLGVFGVPAYAFLALVKDLGHG